MEAAARALLGAGRAALGGAERADGRTGKKSI